MFIIFFDNKGTVQFELISQGQGHAYMGNTEAVTWSCAYKKPKYQPNYWILHHDNALSHKVLSVWQFLAQKLITEMEHLTLFL
jgi:hypothetical protein